METFLQLHYSCVITQRGKFLQTLDNTIAFGKNWCHLWAFHKRHKNESKYKVSYMCYMIWSLALCDTLQWFTLLSKRGKIECYNIRSTNGYNTSFVCSFKHIWWGFSKLLTAQLIKRIAYSMAAQVQQHIDPQTIAFLLHFGHRKINVKMKLVAKN